jgi:acylphosphatase
VAESVSTLRFHVRGKVQGVFYRVSTQGQARSLHLSGWARNLDDGSVEVVASGAEEAVARLGEWLWQGPAGASVASVSVAPYDGAVGSGFTTR